MKFISDTTKILIEKWSDPGNYPNAVASSPLPSYDYVAGIEGEIMVHLDTKDEFNRLLHITDEDSIEVWLSEVCDYKLPDGVLSAKWYWSWKRDDGVWVVRAWVEEVESDPNYQLPEDGTEYDG